jgi:hypothetical protein
MTQAVGWLYVVSISPTLNLQTRFALGFHSLTARPRRGEGVEAGY